MLDTPGLPVYSPWDWGLSPTDQDGSNGVSNPDVLLVPVLNWVVWISIDPRSGQIAAYPKEARFQGWFFGEMRLWQCRSLEVGIQVKIGDHQISDSLVDFV